MRSVKATVIRVAGPLHGHFKLLTIAILILLLLVPIYSVYCAAGADVYFNNQECFVVIEETVFGTRANVFEVIVSSLKCLFYVPTHASGEKHELRVVHISAHGGPDIFTITQPADLVENTEPNLAIIDGRLAYGRWGGQAFQVWRWEHDHFIPAETSIQRDYELYIRAPHHPRRVGANVVGWSERCCLFTASPGESRIVALPFSSGTRELRFTVTADYRRQSLELITGNQKQTIWALDKGPEWVSRSKYRELFQKERNGRLVWGSLAWPF